MTPSVNLKLVHIFNMNKIRLAKVIQRYYNILMKNKTIILDFDYTLFDAKNFKKDLAECLKIFGVDEKLWLETYNKIRYRNNKEADYIPAWHLEILAKKTKNNYKDLEKSYNQVINNAHKYLYADTFNFLKNLKKQKYTLYLLTFGNPRYHKIKIKSAGIDKYFKKIFYTAKDKFQVSDKIPGVDEAIFINDNPNEIVSLKKIHPNARFIQIKRSNGKNFALKLKNIEACSDLKIKI